MTNKQTNSFKFYSNFLDAIDVLPENERANACYEFCKYGITGELPKDKSIAMFCVGVSVSVQKYQGSGGNHNPSGKNQWSKLVKNGQNGQNGQDKQTETETETKKDSKEKKLEDSFEDSFNEFWDLYTPVKSKYGNFVAKCNKKGCYSKYIKLLKDGNKHEDIIAGLKRYLQYCEQNGICSCGVEVFINQRRFETDYGQQKTEDNDDFYEQMIQKANAEFERGNYV